MKILPRNPSTIANDNKGKSEYDSELSKVTSPIMAPVITRKILVISALCFSQFLAWER